MSDTALPRRVLIATMCFAFLVATAVVSVTFARANASSIVAEEIPVEGDGPPASDFCRISRPIPTTIVDLPALRQVALAAQPPKPDLCYHVGLKAYETEKDGRKTGKLAGIRLPDPDTTKSLVDSTKDPTVTPDTIRQQSYDFETTVKNITKKDFVSCTGDGVTTAGNFIGSIPLPAATIVTLGDNETTIKVIRLNEARTLDGIRGNFKCTPK